MKTQPVTLQIATGDARPIFKQIVDGFRLQIVSGQLPTGLKLPSVRALAMQLMINPNTVAKAYNELSSQGFLEARKGLGLFVKEREVILSDEEQNKRCDTAVDRFVNEVAYLDIPPETMLSRLRAKLMAVKNETHNEG